MQNGHNNDLSPSRSPIDHHQGREWSEATFAGDALDGNNPVIPAEASASAGGTTIQSGDGSEDDEPPKLDVEAARKSMERMANIFKDIAQHAEVSTLTRCPYKDAKSRCTAKFGCRNQHFTKNPIDQPICTAKDGDLDYRSAWEID